MLPNNNQLHQNQQHNLLQTIAEIIKEELPHTEIRTHTDIITLQIQTPHNTHTNHYEIFLTKEGITTQKFTPHSHRAERHTTTLADPTCFQQITNFINNHNN